jgi:hypothetical protein
MLRMLLLLSGKRCKNVGSRVRDFNVIEYISKTLPVCSRIISIIY